MANIHYINSPEEFIQTFGQPQIPRKTTIQKKYFWKPETCHITKELLWLETGFEKIDERDIWNDDHISTVRTSTFYSSKGFMLARLKDEV
jgi:hypothetical protein